MWLVGWRLGGIGAAAAPRAFSQIAVSLRQRRGRARPRPRGLRRVSASQRGDESGAAGGVAGQQPQQQVVGAGAAGAGAGGHRAPQRRERLDGAGAAAAAGAPAAAAGDTLSDDVPHAPSGADTTADRRSGYGQSYSAADSADSCAESQSDDSCAEFQTDATDDGHAHDGSTFESADEPDGSNASDTITDRLSDDSCVSDTRACPHHDRPDFANEFAVDGTNEAAQQRAYQIAYPAAQQGANQAAQQGAN